MPAPAPSPTTATNIVDLDPLILRISRAHHQMMGLIQSEIDRLDVPSDLRLQPGMMPLFCLLANEEELTISELAHRLEMAKSSVTGAVRRMEAAGLVCQVYDQSDRRLRRIRLTSLGRSLKPACERIRQAVGERLGQIMSPKEFRQLLALLGTLSEASTNEAAS